MTDYQKYQLQWMIDHGYSLQDLMRELTEFQYDDPEDSDRISTPISELFNEWESDRGFGSEIWVCEEEWKNCEESNWQDGDIYLNPYFGDLWVVGGASFIKINDGYEIELGEPEGFVKVGHISGVINKKKVSDLLSTSSGTLTPRIWIASSCPPKSTSRKRYKTRKPSLTISPR